jgi:hypothetical protein
MILTLASDLICLAFGLQLCIASPLANYFFHGTLSLAGLSP